MNQAMKINFLITRKQFALYGFWNVLSVVGVFGAIAFGFKYLLTLLPLDYLTMIYMFMGMFILLLPLAELSYTDMSPAHKKMLTYFKSVSHEDAKNYYVYRKFVVFIVTILYLFFPLSFSRLPAFLAITCFLGLYEGLVTSAQRLLKDTKKTQQISGAVKYAFIFALMMLPRRFPNLDQMIATIPLVYFALAIVLLYLLIYLNIKRNYETQTVYTYKKVMFPQVKDRHLLYILRTDMLAGLLTILALSVIGFGQPLFTESGFALSLLTSYLTIYQGLLRNDHHKLPLLYHPQQLAQVRRDKLRPILKFSFVYFILAIVLGLYLQNISGFVRYYCIATVAFAVVVLSVKINIEKRRDNRMVTALDFVKMLLLSTMIIFVLARIF